MGPTRGVHAINFVAATTGNGYWGTGYIVLRLESGLIISNPSLYPANMIPNGGDCVAQASCDFSCLATEWNAGLQVPTFIDNNGVTRNVNGVLLRNVSSTWGAASQFISSGSFGAFPVVSFTNINIANGTVTGKLNIEFGDGGYCSGTHDDLIKSFDVTLIYSTLGNVIFNTNFSGTYYPASNFLTIHQ